MTTVARNISARRQTAKAWPPDLSGRTLLMGVLNVTPDSFSDGGQFNGAEAAMAQALRIEAEGADILDIGGESTRPGAAEISADEEMARVLPVIRAVLPRIAIPVSIDTYKGVTAAAALDAGASIVNDVWGLQRDQAMAGVVAEAGAGVCIMHNRTEKDASIDIIADVLRFFETSLAIAARAGIADGKIVLDPGIGFGKTFEQNLICLNRLAEFRRFGRPLLVGCSRKGFVGHYTARAAPQDRLNGSLGAHICAVERGAAIIRAHDIAPHKDALALADAIAHVRLPQQ